MRKKFFGFLMIKFILLGLLTDTLYSEDYFPVDEWRTAAPESQGLNSEILYQMYDEITNKQAYVDSVVIIKNGYLIEEAYFYPWKRDRLHPVYSVSKVIVPMMVGVSLQNKHINSITNSVLSYFPDKAISSQKNEKKQINLKHLLTMTSGLDWPEFETPVMSENNPVNGLITSHDKVSYVLNKPLVNEPGKTFNYNSGASYLLEVIAAKSSQLTAENFVKNNLFSKIGIKNYNWQINSENYYNLISGLDLRPVDMARIGYLFLNYGKWNNQQIMSTNWVTECQTPEIRFNSPFHGLTGFGYQFYIMEKGGYVSIGTAGQYIFVVPEENLVVVFTSQMPDTDQEVGYTFPISLMNNYILRSISDKPLKVNTESYTNHQNSLSKLQKKALKYRIYSKLY